MVGKISMSTQGRYVGPSAEQPASLSSLGLVTYSLSHSYLKRIPSPVLCNGAEKSTTDALSDVMVKN